MLVDGRGKFKHHGGHGERTELSEDLFNRGTFGFWHKCLPCPSRFAREAGLRADASNSSGGFKQAQEVSASRRSSPSLATAWPVRARLCSSPNTTSSTQCSWFSTARGPCPPASARPARDPGGRWRRPDRRALLMHGALVAFEREHAVRVGLGDFLGDGLLAAPGLTSPALSPT